MKKQLLCIAIFLLCVCLVGCSGTSGKNVTGITTTNNMALFEPKCPECNHVGLTKSVNISDGEEYESYHICEKCGHFFEISVKR